MAPMSMRDEYAELMKPNGQGHYLYTPQRFSQLHPGSVGYFDAYGIWTQITDLAEEGRPKRDGFSPIDCTLLLDEPTERMWKTVSSGSEVEASFGLTGGLAGALAAAPVDVSADAKNKSGSIGKAALITPSEVKMDRFVGGAGQSITAWVRENAKTLLNSKYGDDIKNYGIWAIHTTWSTPECAITMESGHSRDTSAGMDVGGTGVGKIGASGSSLKKLTSEGWTTYKAKESDQGLVVSFGGAGFKLHTIQVFRSNPFKMITPLAGKTDVYWKGIYDENGNEIGAEEYRPAYDENGKVIGEKKVDREAEKMEREEEVKKKMKEDPSQVEELFDVQMEPVGMSVSDFDGPEEEL